MLDEIERLKTDPPTPAELSKAKDQVLNSFIFHYDSPDKTLNEQVTLAFYGYPSDFLEKYKTGIEKVTAADVTRVANKYIDRPSSASSSSATSPRSPPARRTRQGHRPRHHHSAAARQTLRSVADLQRCW